ncbi:MAG: Mg/Co/Ni transporter MgtE, CBS domain-containing [Firmicutes bacterium]|nr:Mg/Co/Ni transporter MgtE, CBS domain-containing [Bacillota bacterium]MDI6705736.1 magnesium transporter [Bacillota bacterium]
MTVRILELIKEKKVSRLKEELGVTEAADIAEAIDEMDGKDGLLTFRLLAKEKAAEVFSHLSTNKQAEISYLINERELEAILKDLYFDDMIDYLEEMPANIVKKILRKTGDVERRLINQFLNYPENSAGSIMTIEFVDLKAEMTIGDALERIRRTAPDKETVYTCYVIDHSRVLQGLISLKDLVLADPEKQVKDIMKTSFVSVGTHSDQEEVASVFKKYDLLTVPVVDHENRLVGIITIDDIVDVIDEENTEDFHKMAAIQPSDEEYLSAGIFSLARKRILWLMVLMVSATVSAHIIRRYEEVLSSMVILAAFIPMLMDTGGNAGSQSSTLIIRGLALGEIKMKDFIRVAWKEMRVSMVVGPVLGAVNFVRILFIEGESFKVAMTVSLTLTVTIIAAKIVGGILPIAAKSIKIDPAIMASPLITTIVDAMALMTYFTIAAWLLGLQF